MIKIATITDKDFGIECKEMTSPSIRYAARGIIYKDNKIALFYKEKMNEYKLPGGGIEKNETPSDAFIREVLEETGCLVRIESQLGFTEELKSLTNFKQISYVFVGEVVENRNKLNLTEKEKGEGAKLIWVAPNKALELIEESINNIKPSPVDKDESLYSTKFVVLRDLSILKHYIKLNNLG